MGSQSEIISAIEERVKSAKTIKYSLWTVGITENLERTITEREDENKSTKHLRHWQADSEVIARNVQMHFLNKEMKRDSRGGKHPTYVYIF